jgi:hypothetical protein
MGKLNPRAKTLDSNLSPGVLLHVGLNDSFKAARRKGLIAHKKTLSAFFHLVTPPFQS